MGETEGAPSTALRAGCKRHLAFTAASSVLGGSRTHGLPLRRRSLILLSFEDSIRALGIEPSRSPVREESPTLDDDPGRVGREGVEPLTARATGLQPARRSTATYARPSSATGRSRTDAPRASTERSTD